MYAPVATMNSCLKIIMRERNCMSGTMKKIALWGVRVLAVMGFLFVAYTLSRTVLPAPPEGGLTGTYVLIQESKTAEGFAYTSRSEMITVPHIESNPKQYYYYENSIDETENAVYRGTFTKISETEYLLSGRDKGDEEKIVIDRKGNIIFEESGDVFDKISEGFTITPRLKDMVEEDGYNPT